MGIHLRKGIAFLFLSFVQADEYQVKVTWDHPEDITFEVISSPPPPLLQTIIETDKKEVILNVSDSHETVITVRAVGQLLKSEPSEPLIILPRPEKPSNLKLMIIETSENLKDWSPVAQVFIQDSQPRSFYRANIK